MAPKPVVLKIEFSKTAAIIKDLEAKRDGVLDSFLNVMDSYMEQLRDKIITGYLSGSPIGKYESHPATNKLKNSIEVVPAHVSGNRVLGGVKAGGGRAWYGILFEYGGVKDQYPIRANPEKEGRYAHSLHFFWRGKEYLVKEVMRYAIPPYPFMAPARAEMAPEIRQGMKGLLEYYMQVTE